MNIPHKTLTVLDYFSVIGVVATAEDMQRLGEVALKLSKDNSISIDRVRDASFGPINSYREEMLDAAFVQLMEGL